MVLDEGFGHIEIHKNAMPLPPRFGLFALLLALTACAKDDPETSLPAVTQQGLNTGGFLVNGKAYPATGWPGSFLSTFGGTTYGVEGGYSSWPSFFPPAPNPYELRLNSPKGNRTTVTLFLREPQVGEFALNRDPLLSPSVADTMIDHATICFDGSSRETYSTDARHTGRIIFTRADARIHAAAGTFEFTAVSNLDPRKTVTVSAGRFDNKW